MGAGAKVVVDERQLVLKALTPIPALRKGVPLHPDDPDDPYVFRVDYSALGLGTLPVVFTTTGDGPPGQRLWLDLMAFDRRPFVRNPRRLVAVALTARALAARVARRPSRPEPDSPAAPTKGGLRHDIESSSPQRLAEARPAP
jgi:hypothetical protein